GHLCRDVSPGALGPALAFLLAFAVSRHDGVVAAIPQSIGLGRVRSQHLLYRLFDFLVCGFDSRRGHASRPGEDAREAGLLWPFGAGLARLSPALATASVGLFVAGRAGHANCAFGVWLC